MTLVAFGLLLFTPQLNAEILITNNREVKADFKGLVEAHEWIVVLSNKVNNIRFEIQSPTARLIATLFAPNGKAIKLYPAAAQKGKRVATYAVFGRSIEASPRDPLPPGRYTIRVRPYRDFAGEYSIKILEPSISREEREPEKGRDETAAELEKLEKQRDEIDRKIKDLKRDLQK